MSNNSKKEKSKKEKSKSGKIKFNRESAIDYREIEAIRNRVRLTSEDVRKYLKKHSVKNT